MNVYGHLSSPTRLLLIPAKSPKTRSFRRVPRRLGQADPGDIFINPETGAQELNVDLAKALIVHLGNMYLGVHPLAQSPTPEDFQFWMASTAQALAAAGNPVPQGAPTAIMQIGQSPAGSEWLVNAKLWRDAVNQGLPIDTLTMAWAKDRNTAAALTQNQPDFAVLATVVAQPTQPARKRSSGGIAALVIGGLVIAGLAIAAS